MVWWEHESTKVGVQPKHNKLNNILLNWLQCKTTTCFVVILSMQPFIKITSYHLNHKPTSQQKQTLNTQVHWFNPEARPATGGDIAAALAAAGTFLPAPPSKFNLAGEQGRQYY